MEDEMPEGLDLHMFNLNIGTMEDLSDDDGKGVEEEEMKIINEKKCIVFEDRLLELVKTALEITYRDTHGQCVQPFVYRTVQKGTAIIIIWECDKRRGPSWTCQPRYKGIFVNGI